MKLLTGTVSVNKLFLYIFQAVLARTIKQAGEAAAAAGLEEASPAMMELKLIQSREEILNPPTMIEAEVLSTS